MTRSWLLLLFFCINLFAEESSFNSDNERIYLLRFQHGLILSESLIAYPHESGLYFSLTEFSESLEVYLESSSSLGAVQGFIRIESNKFELDVNNCSYLSKGSEKKYNCEDIQIYDSDIFVKQDLIEEWFELKMRVDPFRSEIIIDSKFSFPVEDRVNRSKKKTSNIKKEKELTNIDYRKPDLLSGLVFSQNLNFTEESSDRKSSVENSLGFQFLGFEANFYHNKTDSNETSYSQLTRRSNKSDLLGIKETRLLNQSLPSLSLIKNAESIEGASFSSYPINRSGDFSTQSIEGPLSANWEVELYFLGVLIDRYTDDGSGRYIFKNVPIQLGRNQYRLLFYGPHGEQREENKVISLSSLFQSHKEFDYLLVYGKNKDDTTYKVLSADYGLLKQLSLSFDYFNEESFDKTTTKDFLNLGVLGYFSNLSYKLQQTQGSEDLGSASQIELISDFYNLRSNIQISQFSDLKSTWVDENFPSQPEQERKINLTYAFNNFPFRIGLENRSVDFKSRTELIENSLRLGTYLWKTNINLIHSTVEDTTESSSTELALNWNSLKHSYRLVTSLSDEEVDSYEASYRFKPNRKNSFRIQASKNISSSIDTIQLSYNHEFKYLNLSLNTYFDSDDTYSAGLNLNYTMASSGIYTPHLRGRELLKQSFLRVSVFLDENANGIWDENELPMENVEIAVDKINRKQKTDSDGILILDELPSHQFFQVRVDEISLPEPSYFPLQTTYNLELSSGKVHELAIPVRALGEVDGFVKRKLKKNGKSEIRRAKVQLNALAKEGKSFEQLTDTDGYFVFEKIPAGKYKLELSSSYLESLNFEKTEAIEIEITGKGGYIDEYLFELEEK